MRWIRLLMAFITARFRRPVSVLEETRLNFRVWITDIDVSLMNHAAMMTIMEMGRVDFMVRTGFFKLANEKKWYFPAAALSVQFIRPLKMFQKAHLTTRIFHMDEKWIYLEHKIVRSQKEIAFCIVKSTIKQGRVHVPTDEIAQIMGITELPKEGRDLIETYEKANRLVNERFLQNNR